MNKLLIFSSNRALRKKLSIFKSDDTHLPKMMTISEFISRAAVVKDKIQLDNDTRVVFLKRCCEPNQLALLGIDDDFFRFAKNSEYIFSFFEEMAVEMVGIETVFENDIKNEAYEHLSILSFIFESYSKTILESGFFDQTTLPKVYSLNDGYLQSFDEIEFEAQGYLTNFEIDLLVQTAALRPFVLRINNSEYSYKLSSRLKSRFGFDLKPHMHYALDLSNMRVLLSSPIKTACQIESHGFSTRVEQVGFIRQKVQELVQVENLMPEDITIVLPDESFAEMLSLFDEEGNFNFALGFDYCGCEIYQLLDAIKSFMLNDSFENSARLSEYSVLFGEEIQSLKNIWREQIDAGEFRLMIEQILAKFKASGAKEQAVHELSFFSKLSEMLSGSSFSELFSFYLGRLSKLKIDDTHGGKITVMGVLETRGVEFNTVIVPDFNDSKVPKQSQKDMYLSNILRQKAGLPTSEDRQNLQKHYYLQLFCNCNRAIVCYEQNETQAKSIFLDELDGL